MAIAKADKDKEMERLLSGNAEQQLKLQSEIKAERAAQSQRDLQKNFGKQLGGAFQSTQQTSFEETSPPVPHEDGRRRRGRGRSTDPRAAGATD